MSVHYVAAQLTADSPGHGSAIFQLPETIASNLDMSRYRGNPLLTWVHAWGDEPPIGSADSLEVDGSTLKMAFRLDPSTPFHAKVSRGFIQTAELYFEQSDAGGPWVLMNAALVSVPTPNEGHLDSTDTGGFCDCRSGQCICVRFDSAPKPRPLPKETPVMSTPIPARWKEPLAAHQDGIPVHTETTDPTDPDGEVWRRANRITLDRSHESESVRQLREARARAAKRRLDAGEAAPPPSQNEIPQRWREPLQATK